MKFLETSIYRLEKDILACHPQHIVYNFFQNNFNKYISRFDSLFFKSRNKFFTLLSTQKRNIRHSFDDAWVSNLTNIVIPDFLKRTLSYSGKYNAPYSSNNKISVIEFIKEFESNILKNDNNIRNNRFYQ